MLEPRQLILDFGFWILELNDNQFPKIQNPKSKIQNRL